MDKRKLFLAVVLAILALPVGFGRSTAVPMPDGSEVTVKEKGDEEKRTVQVLATRRETGASVTLSVSQSQ